ncbi:hypothetical protein CBR_g55022 [Chara braunii]|uniref:Uncharacterized protein n=1 Tax=Chara braunii TaxID=69332 RepID=A0A388MCL7_CHABU|nr:hypothetical protein CBR_g55022 [Chara braunii]|eukprot:GBG92253.1 hypothetical protein CBR_g55022 [Chara braunii]
MAISYSMAAQKAMSEREKQDFALRQGGTTMSKSGQKASQSGTVSRAGEAKSRSLGQKAMDFLLEKTQIKAEIKITKEVIKGEGGKEEEVEVWEYPEEDIQSLNDLYEKHAVLFNFSGRSKELSLNEKRRWVMDRLIAMEDVPRKEPEIVQAEEDQRESSGDTESEASSEEEEEEEEEQQDELDEKDWSREQWIKEVEQLEWGRTIECEIRLAYHKHLRNLQ